jgi:hypothetical protein
VNLFEGESTNEHEMIYLVIYLVYSTCYLSNNSVEVKMKDVERKTILLEKSITRFL